MLTMKYGKHQMMLIKKRMSVESWIDDQLNKLYKAATVSSFFISEKKLFLIDKIILCIFIILIF